MFTVSFTAAWHQLKSDRSKGRGLPASHAFVVQLAREALGTHASFHGRAEHVVSGHATHFGTLEALLAFIQGELAGQQESSDQAEANEADAVPGARRSQE